jgi:DNA-directed RNA polymerase specialized sigma24 family protein
MLKGLAIKLCNHRDISNDLFQEFLLYLCEKPDEFLIKKHNEIQFLSYCSNVIKGLNSDRHRANKLINTRNPLVERINDVCVENFDISDEIYNFDIDMKFERVVKFVKEQPELKGQILFKSVVSTTRQAASELGMKERQLIYQNVKFKSEIKNNIK